MTKMGEKIAIIFILACLVFSFFLALQPPPVQTIISPIPDTFPVPTPTIKRELLWRGTASYYSEAGCLGCSATLTMANGERLDDSVLTIAMPPAEVREHKLLNKVVTVQNLGNQAVTSAKITDTGGFAKYGRIADISLAVKRSLRCGDLCDVEIALVPGVGFAGDKQ